MKRIETVNGKHMKIADKMLHIEPTTAENKKAAENQKIRRKK